MATPRYLPVATYKDWARDEVTVDDSLVEAAINAAETAIDGALNRKMIAVTAGAPGLSTRVYRPTRGDLAWIHDCTEITAISDNGVTPASSLYQFEPLNNLNDAGETVPYDRIRRITGSWYIYGAKATLSVTARWGWAAIPPQIVEACKIVTKDMLFNREMRAGLVSIVEAGGVGSRENRTVREAIERYRSARPTGLVG